MEYVYSALLLHAAGKPIDENGVKSVLKAAGVEVNDARVKGLVRGAGLSDPAGNRILLHHRYRPYDR